MGGLEDGVRLLKHVAIGVARCIATIKGDTALVTEEGAESLADFPRQLISV